MIGERDFFGSGRNRSIINENLMIVYSSKKFRNEILAQLRYYTQTDVVKLICLNLFKHRSLSVLSQHFAHYFRQIVTDCENSQAVAILPQ